MTTTQPRKNSLHVSWRVLLLLFSQTGIIVLLIFALIWQVGNNAVLATRRVTLVQLGNGDTVLAQPEDGDHRDGEVILKTAQNWVELTYQKYPILADGNPDPGMEVLAEDDLQVPTSTYEASLLLIPSLRQAFLEEYARNFVPLGYFKQKNQTSVVRFFDAYVLPGGNPEEGWSVEVIATIINSRGRQELSESPLNIRIKLLPSPPQLNPLGEENPSPIQQALIRMRAAGLTITSVENMSL